MKPNPPKPPMEELLAHTEFLRNLVRGLVQAEDQVEDVIQETWLKALRSPPSQPDKLRPWLGRVARNTALNLRRRERRRLKREQSASTPDEVPSTSEIIERQALAGELVQYVTELDEPYRTTLLLRFYEGLPPREIATRTNTPVNTVKTHIQRGLSRLREQLDRRHADQRQAMCLALVGLGGLDPASLGPAETTPPAGPAGGGGPTPLLLGVGALALLALPILLVWFASDSAPPPDRVATRPPANTAGGEAAPTTRRVTPPAHPTPPTTGAWTVRGRVVDGRGRPVAGARIRASARPPLSGEVLHDLLTVGRLAASRRRHGNPGPHPEDEEDLWSAVRKGMVADRVPPDREQAPTLSGPGGSFQLGPLRGEACWLRAASEGLATHRTVRATRGKEVTLVVLPAGTVRVEVRDGQGKPVPGAPVKLLDQGVQAPPRFRGAMPTALTGRSGPDGTLRFEGLRPPGPYLAVVAGASTGPGLAGPVSISPGEEARLALRVPPAGAVELRAVDSRARPLAGVQVRCHIPGLERRTVLALDLPRAVTGADGKALLSGLPPGRVLLWSRLPGRAGVAALVRLEPGERTVHRVVLPAGATLTGRITDPAGRGLAGVLVGRSPDPPGTGELDRILDLHEMVMEDQACRTGPDGHFRLGGLPKGTINLLALHPGHRPQALRGLRTDRTAPLAIRLLPRAAVHGRVMAPEGRLPEGTTLRLWRLRSNRRLGRLVHSLTEFGPDGSFHLPLATGTYRLHLRAPDRAPITYGPLEIKGEGDLVLPASLVLRPGATVTGRVLDARGRPAAGVRLEAHRIDRHRCRVTGSWPLPARTWTGPDGSWRLAGLGAGPHRIEARGRWRGYARHPDPVVLTPGGVRRDLDLRLEPAAILAGRVADDTGRHGAGALVILGRQWSPDSELLRVPLCRDGSFLVPGLAPGSWTVVVNLFPRRGPDDSVALEILEDRHLTRSLQVVLRSGETCRPTLAPLPPSGLVIRGTVTKGNRPLAGASVATGPPRNGDPGSERTVLTNEQGRFVIPVPGPGEYALLVTPDAGGQGCIRRVRVTVAQGVLGRVLVDFPPTRVRGRLVAGTAVEDLEDRVIVVRDTERKRLVAMLRTGPGGRFRVEGLPPGRYTAAALPVPQGIGTHIGGWGDATALEPETLTGAGAGAPVGRSRPWTLPTDDAWVEFDLPVEPAGALRGRVPAGTREVQVRVAGWPLVWRATPDTQGVFSLPGLPPGPARIGIGDKERRIRLHPNQTLTFDALR